MTSEMDLVIFMGPFQPEILYNLMTCARLFAACREEQAVPILLHRTPTPRMPLSHGTPQAPKRCHPMGHHKPQGVTILQDTPSPRVLQDILGHTELSAPRVFSPCPHHAGNGQAGWQLKSNQDELTW